jgi:WD40 repeat protein
VGPKVDSSLVVWDLRTGEWRQAQEFKGYGQERSAPQTSRNGRRVISVVNPPPPDFAEAWFVVPGKKLTRAQGIGSLALCLTGSPYPPATVMGAISAYGQNRLTPVVQSKESFRAAAPTRVYDVDERKYIFGSRPAEMLGPRGLDSISEDGDWLALARFTWKAEATTTGLSVFQVSTGREVKLADSAGALANVAEAFSPDGRWFADTEYQANKKSHRPRQLRLWELASGRRLGGYTFPEGQNDCQIAAIRFAPRGDRLVGLVAMLPPRPEGQPAPPGPAVERQPWLLVVWRVEPDGALVREFDREVGSWDAFVLNARHVAFSPDGRLVACIVSAPRGQLAVRTWDLPLGKLLHELGSFVAPHATYAGERLAFSPDGRRLFAGGKVWDLRTGLELLELTPDLVRDRPAASRPVFAYDGDLVYGLFASEEGIDSYAFDGTPRP